MMYWVGQLTAVVVVVVVVFQDWDVSRGRLTSSLLPDDI